ncbi:uncharacterized protein LOC122388334 [Amphibalanus amphitrite]|uniref:uncharacterized protein LOC122388334 n=1 Tax=Amphibalanus amphitrite TaxID=1232801 RepID=UPI001C920390|nr:uncharacterized protein LOC122388334 [Amphibalanus amphitrite]XP_043235278.1 uncharacterized protein LOC122388334 [Amphibalanus amphitrite]
MFTDLVDLLHTDTVQGHFLAVTEQPPADASFVLCHLINRALRAGGAVRVLALDKPPAHYRHLCAKCGADVRQAEAAGALTFVDGAQLTARALRSDSGALTAGGPLPVRAVFDQLTGSADRSASLLVLDNLSALAALGCRPADLLLLVHNLQRWCRRRDAALATLTSRDADDRTLCQLAAAVAGSADLAVTVRGLSSGHCAEVTGELELRRPGEAALLRQFKAEDRNVRVFAAGTSRAVL